MGIFASNTLDRGLIANTHTRTHTHTHMKKNSKDKKYQNNPSPPSKPIQKTGYRTNRVLKRRNEKYLEIK